MAKYSKARVEQIRGHLAELERRGIPVAQFAEQIGVAAWTVYTWKRRFDSSAAAQSRANVGPTTASALHADLIEVERRPVGSSIEIVVGAVIVRVSSGFDSSDLEGVLRVVRTC